jgi:hypothetical protein
MSEQPYTTRELDIHFNDLKEQLALILAQTTRTNGRVTKLENWQALIIGGASIVSFIVIPTIVWIFSDVLNRTNITTNKLEANITKHISNDKI